VTADFGEPEIIVDLSRLLSRVMHPAPTGVDRVEMAYALGLLAIAPASVSFAVSHPAGPHGRVSTSAAVDFLHLTASRWESEGQDETRASRLRRAAGACFALSPFARPARRTSDRPKSYLHLSARSLERTSMFRAILERENARFIPFVHDIIPITHPEYSRPNGPAMYKKKMATVAALASGVIVNSKATAQALSPLLAATGRDIPIHAAPLGVDAPNAAPAAAAGSPGYFVCLGTIEPRKNHLLLLNLWRGLAETLGPGATPRLVLIGRRGWENEMVLDMLDRCPALKDVVEERGRLSDSEQRDVLRGARAILLPSFVEGFGLPVAEALALGVPVIASDLAALREAGGDAADYLDPLDGSAWRSAILDYAEPRSARRAAQIERIAKWTAPTWSIPVRSSYDFIRRICAQDGPPA